MQDERNYRIGISGHRDLKQERIAHFSLQVARHLEDIKNKAASENKTLRVLSPLADGADRLVVETAKKMGIDYEVILPMKQDLYEKDFDENSKKEFRKLLAQAKTVSVAPLCGGCDETNITDYGLWRNRQYQKLGFYLVDKADCMIFMWDGDETLRIGGTYDILCYAKQKRKPLEIIPVARER